MAPETEIAARKALKRVLVNMIRGKLARSVANDDDGLFSKRKRIS